jgi:hypothetical protein
LTAARVDIRQHVLPEPYGRVPRAGGANAAWMARKADKYCARLAADRHRRFGLFATFMLPGGRGT